MSSSVLEDLLEDSSDELPRMSDLEDKIEDESEKIHRDKNVENEIVISSDDEIIEISSEEQLPSSSSFVETQNNNRKSRQRTVLRAAISRPCKKFVENVNDSLERVGSIYKFTTYYKNKDLENNSKTVKNIIRADVETKNTNFDIDKKKTRLSVKEIQKLLQRKVP